MGTTGRMEGFLSGEERKGIENSKEQQGPGIWGVFFGPQPSISATSLLFIKENPELQNFILRQFSSLFFIPISTLLLH
jgi:hypothetical protein